MKVSVAEAYLAESPWERAVRRDLLASSRALWMLRTGTSPDPCKPHVSKKYGYFRSMRQNGTEGEEGNRVVSRVLNMAIGNRVTRVKVLGLHEVIKVYFCL